MNKDYYRTLGVSENADDKQIKAAYRRLAKQYHPDRNKGDANAENKFKEIGEAYDVLKDVARRREYDTYRRYGARAFNTGPHTGFHERSAGSGNPFGPGSFSFNLNGENIDDLGSIEEMLSAFFGGRAAGPADPFRSKRSGVHTGPKRGTDLAANIEIPFLEAVSGSRRMLTIGQRRLRVRIPAGIDTGGKIRLRGQGEPGLFGGPNGDLIITVKVMPNEHFERKGNDIYSSVEISFVDAIKGCKVQAKTLTKTVSLTVPPGTQPGTKLRLKGMGLAVGGQQGDQYVEIKVRIPTELSEKQRRLLDEW